MIEWIRNLSRNAKRALALATDMVTLPAAIWLAFTLRLEEVYAPDMRIATTMALTTVITIALFVRMGLYRAVIRYAGLQLFNTVFIGVSISVFMFTVLGFLFQAPVPRSVPFIYFGIALIAICASRLFVRHLLTIDRHETTKKVVIYGAGSAGLQLCNALQQGMEYRPVAFIDDDKSKQGTILNGLRVYKPRKLDKLKAEFEVDEVLLAISSLTPARRGEIVHSLVSYNVKVKTIPGMLELIDGTSQIQEIRELKVEELLGREPVPPEPHLLEACIKGKSVLVTGAGGSIGSELCRQIAEIGPERLVLLEASEFALYSIEQELSEKNLTIQIIPKLGSVQNRSLISGIIGSESIQTIYHAAAYKHVPLVESNVIAGVQNNVFGTLVVAEEAKSAGVENFILISTDKAVRPTNIMGATKRIAEQILQAFAEDSNTTKFCMVRFGNVLASSGSVVPRFKKQIRNGGPVTVTHPEITRFFMTIPEAVQLVIQAGTLGKGGDVFVLDMGEPVKINQLAETMISLMGKSLKTNANPEGEIAIVFTGLRPGEKLYEELLIGDNCVGTEHPKITRANENKTQSKDLIALLHDLSSSCNNADHLGILQLISKIVPEYVPSKDIKLIFRQEKPNANVVTIDSRSDV
jgi:FlaA1/EpsC-like NDP-sugar epimerase